MSVARISSRGSMLSHGNAHAFNFSYFVDLPTFLLPKDGILVGFQHFLSVKLPVFICCGIKLKRKKKTHSLIYAEHFFTFYFNSCSLSTTTSERKSQLVLLLLLFYYSRRCNKPKRRNKKKWIIFVFERPRSVLASSKIRRYTLCVTNYILLHAVCRCVWRLFNLWVKKEKI